MATTYNLVLVDGNSHTYARKDAAVKAGEKTGKGYQVLTSTGTVVHEKIEPKPAHKAAAPKPAAKPAHKAAAPKPAAPRPTLHDENDEIPDEEEKPMTKSEAYTWFKRSREGLRDAERAIERGDGKSADLVEMLNDAQGAIAVLLDALDNLGINGVA